MILYILSLIIIDGIKFLMNILITLTVQKFKNEILIYTKYDFPMECISIDI